MYKFVNSCVLLIIFLVPAVLMAQQATVEQLQQRCEEMRENRLRPLREAEIEKCKADETKDPTWCEKYYQDYGNATRGAGGKYTPRMFDDLAPCVQAREMKARQREGTLPADKRGTTTTDLQKMEKELTTSPEEAAAAQQGKVTPSSRDSTLESTSRDTEKTESSRESTLPTTSRDSTSGKSER